MRSCFHIALLYVLLLGGTLGSSQAAGAHEPEASEPEAQVQALLLDGVRAFRAEQFDVALSIFRRVEQSSPRADIGMYQGMALHKLGRHAEALAEFRSARRSGVSEAIADYYDAVSCYRLGLYERARVGFASLLHPQDGKGSPLLGPRLREGAARFVSAMERSAPRTPDPARPDTALSRRIELALKQAQDVQPSKLVDSQEWLEEAALLLLALPIEGRTPYLATFQEILDLLQQAPKGRMTVIRSAELGVLLQRVRTAPTR